jgi:hypothetical protein
MIYQNLIKKTATARALNKYKYQNQNPKSNSDYLTLTNRLLMLLLVSLICFIFITQRYFYCKEYVKYSNPYGTSSNTEIRKVMPNYFASLKYKKEVKSMTVSNRVTEEEQQNNIIMYLNKRKIYFFLVQMYVKH